MAVSGADMAVLAEYRSSLNDLDFNSKPMINMLTMLAEEHENLADGVVKIIKDRILQVRDRKHSLVPSRCELPGPCL